jgi:hypothetical protein
MNGKKILHWIGPDIIDNLIDIRFYDKSVDEPKDTQVSWYYDYIAKESRSANLIIPITIHKRRYDNLLDKIESFRDIPYNYDYNDSLYVFYYLERTGLRVNLPIFKQIHTDVNFAYNTSGNTIYTWYNLYTTTTRPSNTFNTIHFSALPHESGIRNAIVPEDDSILLEFDFRAYHMYILAELVGFEPPENINTYLAKQYFNTDNPTPEQYTLSKGISYKAIYTESKEYNHIEFIRLCKEYKEKLFKTQDGDLTKLRVLAHKLQYLETQRNVKILKRVIEYISTTNSKVLLYTFDSILFNIPRTDKHVISRLKSIIDSPSYPVKMSYGKDYGNMQSV